MLWCCVLGCFPPLLRHVLLSLGQRSHWQRNVLWLQGAHGLWILQELIPWLLATPKTALSPEPLMKRILSLMHSFQAVTSIVSGRICSALCKECSSEKHLRTFSNISDSTESQRKPELEEF